MYLGHHLNRKADNMTEVKKIYYAYHSLPFGKREMTDEEFREYIKEQLNNKGIAGFEMPYFRPLVDLKENEEVVYL